MLKSGLCNYSGACIHVKGNIKILNTVAAIASPNNRNKNVIFKNCAPFTDFISKINKTQVNNAIDLGIIMPMYNLIEYSDTFSKTRGSLCRYYRDEH